MGQYRDRVVMGCVWGGRVLVCVGREGVVCGDGVCGGWAGR